MTLVNHFFSRQFCKYTIEYFIGWVFLILGYCFVISIVLANPTKMDYGPNKRLIEGIFILGGCFLITIFARCICYRKPTEEEEPLYQQNNEIRFNPYNTANDILV